MNTQNPIMISEIERIRSLSYVGNVLLDLGRYGEADVIRETLIKLVRPHALISIDFANLRFEQMPDSFKEFSESLFTHQLAVYNKNSVVHDGLILPTHLAADCGFNNVI